MSGGAPEATPRGALTSPAAARNRGPILEVLRRVLPARGTVLEIASGSGEHALHFARALPGLDWQPSDPDPACLRSIDAWAETARLPNLRPAIALDVLVRPWPINDRVDAIVCINMVHVAPWPAGVAVIAGAGRWLAERGLLYLYGPYRVGGAHTAPSNQAFDRSLRARDPAWGVRDLEEVVRVAGEGGLALAETVAMPANNLSLVFGRAPSARRPGG